MAEPLRLMAVLAHPDDESLGMGGVLAKYAAEGVQTYLVTATRGERGRYFTPDRKPGLDVVARVREAELRAAADELGVHDVRLLDYVDGDLDRADPEEAVGRIVGHLRRVRPHVVVTFDPFGAYGHPDHIAICQFATAAVVAAADPAFAGAGPVEGAPDPGTPSDGRSDASADEDATAGERSDPPGHGGARAGDHPAASTETRPAPHRVSKLYYMAWNEPTWAAYQAAFKTLVSNVDGVARQASPWPDWSITTRVDTRDHWETVWRAVQCHETQMSMYARLGELTPENHEALWGVQTFYRAYSTVNGGRETETDLFDGLR